MKFPYSRPDDNAERENFATAASAFLASPEGPSLPVGCQVIALLTTDVMGECFDEIEAHDGPTVIAVGRLPVGADDPAAHPHLVVYSLTRSAQNVTQHLMDYNLAWCHIGPTRRAADTAAAVVDQCTFFWWKHDRRLHGWVVQLLSPAAVL